MIFPRSIELIPKCWITSDGLEIADIGTRYFGAGSGKLTGDLYTPHTTIRIGAIMWDDDNAIYHDGEWITWTEINGHLARQELQAQYPEADIGLIPIFESLLATAEDYFHHTGRHLQVYGDIGELYGAIMYGLKPHRNYAQGSDGKIGNQFVEVKTITPFKNSNSVCLNMRRNFSQVLIVRIGQEFEVRGKLIDRKALPKARGEKLTISWDQFVHADA